MKRRSKKKNAVGRNKMILQQMNMYKAMEMWNNTGRWANAPSDNKFTISTSSFA